MNKFIKMAPAAIIIVALALMLMLGRNILDSKLPVLSGNYYKDFRSEAELEYYFSQKGPYKVEDYTMDSGNGSVGEIFVSYPKESNGEKFPMIIIANPSKMPASIYKPFFERLASWGFVVVGNEDQQSGNGESTSKTLEVMEGLVDTHPLRDVIDYDSIGVAGYSQGGAGALAAVTEYDNGSKFKAIFTGSAIEPGIAGDMNWTYDVSKVTIPYFLTAGTGETDSGGGENAPYAPLVSLMDAYNAMTGDAMKVRARAAGADHADMLKRCDGYLTAWMLYQLQGDSRAELVFKGDKAEILSNANWQDVEKNQ